MVGYSDFAAEQRLSSRVAEIGAALFTELSIMYFAALTMSFVA